MSRVHPGPPPGPAPVTDGPLPLLDLLDGALAAIRQRPRTLLAIALVHTIPMAVINGWLARDTVAGGSWVDALAEPTSSGGSLPWADAAVVSYLLNWLATASCGVGVSRVIGGWLIGADRTAAEALAFLARRWWVVAVAFVAIHVAELVGFVALLVPGLWLVVAFSLTSPVIANEEHLGPLAAMGRSVTLIRRGFGSAAGLIILVGIVGAFIGSAIGAIPEVGAMLIGDARAWPLLSAAQILSGTLLLPFTAAAMCLLYLDLRFRTEGLDLELRLSRVAGIEVDDLGGAERAPRVRAVPAGSDRG